MYPSINNLAFATTNNNNHHNNRNPNLNSSSFLPIHSPCIFYEDDPFLQRFHGIPHKYDTPIVAHYQPVPNIKNHSTNTSRNNVHQTPSDHELRKGSPDDFFCINSNKITSKRSSKKDRHNKINTVHGPRYPRMRLSVDIANKFFGLQDMLGFDKASKTVQWLLNKSDTAIKHLITNSKRAHNISSSNTTGVSSTSIGSECEVLSGNIEDSPLSLPKEVTAMEKAKQEAVREKREVITKEGRNSPAFHFLAKERRKRARERARERTVEKRIRLGNGNYYDTQAKNVPYPDRLDQNINWHSASWSPLTAGVEESSAQIIVNDHPSYFHSDHQEPASQSTSTQHELYFVDGDPCLLNTSGNWSPSSYFSHLQPSERYNLTTYFID